MGLIERLQEIRSGPGPSAIYDKSKRRLDFIESIRWDGEIYCGRCKSPLIRVPADKYWYDMPFYNPKTGAMLSYQERFGELGLMVCEKWEDARKSSMMVEMVLSGNRTFQKAFEQMNPGLVMNHGMYYVDKPPLE